MLIGRFFLLNFWFVSLNLRVQFSFRLNAGMSFSIADSILFNSPIV